MAKAKSGHKKVRQKTRQVNQCDKILHENLEEELPDDIQHTKERKPDVLKK
jgi:transcriptional regulator of met regulon